MTDPATMSVATQVAADRVMTRPAVSWRYLFTDMRGRLLDDLPMTGVSMTEVLSGAGEATGTVNLASRAVQKKNPASLTVTRRTAMWAQRITTDAVTGQVIEAPILWGGPVVGRERSRSGRSMTLRMFSWAGYFASRLVRVDRTFTQADKFLVMRWLFDQCRQFEGGTVAFDTSGIAGGQINAGTLHDRTYLASDLQPVLTAAKELAGSGNGFDWRIAHVRQAGGDRLFRAILDLGYPRIGRVASQALRWSTSTDRDRAGELLDYTINEDGSAVYNYAVGLGAGTGPGQLRSVVTARDVGRDEVGSFGYPLWETSLGSSTNQLETQAALDAHTRGAMLAGLASEVQVTNVKVRGDLPPVLTSYAVGDDLTLDIEDEVTPEGVRIVGQMVGRKIEPAEQDRNELVTMTVQGNPVAA